MQKLLIIGGGYTAIDLASKLNKKFDIVIIEPNKEFIHYIGSLRGFVNPDFEKHLHFDYKKYNVVHDFVSSIDFNNHSVMLNNGDLMKYDKIVIATGVKHGIFSNHELSNRIANANKILIEGGGPIGIELAGELVEYTNDKDITLIHNKELLLDERYNNNLRVKLTELVASKVNLLLYPNVIDKNDYDLVIKSYGLIPNTTFIDKRYLDVNGYIKVNNKLEIINATDAYAVGDVNDIEHVKTLINGYRQSGFLAKYIIRPIGYYKPRENQIIGIPFGPKLGYTSLPLGLLGGALVTSTIKGRDLMVRKIHNFFD
jgi:apoptosis-inducing factor 2